MWVGEQFGENITRKFTFTSIFKNTLNLYKCVSNYENKLH